MVFNAIEAPAVLETDEILIVAVLVSDTANVSSVVIENETATEDEAGTET